MRSYPASQWSTAAENPAQGCARSLVQISSAPRRDWGGMRIAHKVALTSGDHYVWSGHVPKNLLIALCRHDWLGTGFATPSPGSEWARRGDGICKRNGWSN